MWTDRCHRICTRCAHDNEALTEPRVALPRDVRRCLEALGGTWLADPGSRGTLAAKTED